MARQKIILIAMAVLMLGLSFYIEACQENSNKQKQVLPERFFFTDIESSEKNCWVSIRGEEQFIRVSSHNCINESHREIVSRLKKIIVKNNLSKRISNSYVIQYILSRNSKEMNDLVVQANKSKSWPVDIIAVEDKLKQSHLRRHLRHKHVVKIMQEMAFFRDFINLIRECSQLELKLDVYPYTQSERIALIERDDIVERNILGSDKPTKQYYPQHIIFNFIIKR